MKWLIGSIVALSLFPTVAHAATPYFEFDPGYSEPILVNSVGGSVDEVFLPLNEFLSGMDLWLSTGGTVGSATFSLFDPSGTELTESTLSLPAVADSPGGTRFHIGFPNQFSVAGGSPYILRVSSGLVGLRLYEAGTIPLLAHNAQPQLQYSTGQARINGEDKTFGFKYALYENREYAPPILSNLAVVQPVSGTAAVTWTANEPVDARVIYNGTTVPYTGGYSSCLPSLSLCSVTLAVEPGTSYGFTLTARDIWGNASSLDGSFVALGVGQTPPPTPTPVPSAPATPTVLPPDTTKPVITDLRTVNVTGTGFTVAWTTNEAANAIVVALQLPYLVFGAGNSDATLELEHAITLSGLTQDTSYRVKVLTSDASGNTASESIDVLTTRPTPLPVSPVPQSSQTPVPATTSPTPMPTISVGPATPGGTDVQWSPVASGQAPDGYRVDVIGSGGTLIRTVHTTGTIANVGDVPAGARVIVYANNAGVYQKVAQPASVIRGISLAERLLVMAPYILGVIILAIGATILIMKFRGPKVPLPPAHTSEPPTSGAMLNPTEF
ncbi:MAG TPA: hypothetical protein VMU12_00940 [Candidatus Paceibacterota bacterium]|nr:hypothetical protein [Candidatus Paceibacterota bacterium]